MTGQPIPLTAEILDAYRTASKAAGSTFSEELLPGLTDDEITALVAPLGIDPSGEVRTLWSWGVVPELPRQRASCEVSYVLTLLHPRLAVKATLGERTESWTGHPPPYEWLVIGDGNSSAVSVDCTGAPAIGPVWESPKASVPEPAGPSLGALFLHWTALIESGEMEIYGTSWSGVTGDPYAFLD